VLPCFLRAAIFGLVSAFYGEVRFIRNNAPKMLAGLGVSDADLAPILEAGISLSVRGQAVRALHGVDNRAKLAAITQPVPVVNGANDRDMIPQEAAFMAVARDATRRVSRTRATV